MQAIIKSNYGNLKINDLTIFNQRIERIFNKVSDLQLDAQTGHAKKIEQWQEIFKNTNLSSLLESNTDIIKLGTKNLAIINKLEFTDIITMYHNFNEFCNHNTLPHQSHKSYKSILGGRNTLRGFFESIFGDSVRTEKFFVFDNKLSRRLDTITKLITPIWQACSAIGLYNNKLYLALNAISGKHDMLEALLETTERNLDSLLVLFKKISNNEIDLNQAALKYATNIYPTLGNKEQLDLDYLKFKFSKIIPVFNQNFSNINQFHTFICRPINDLEQHAEQILCKNLIEAGATGKIAIGISKPCCFTCADEILINNNKYQDRLQFEFTATHTSFIKNAAKSLSANQNPYSNQIPACDMQGHPWSDYTSNPEDINNAGSKTELKEKQQETIESIKSSGRCWIPKESEIYKQLVGSDRTILNTVTTKKKSIKNNFFSSSASKASERQKKITAPKISAFDLMSAAEKTSPVKNITFATAVSSLNEKTTKNINFNDFSSIVKTLDFGA